MAHNAIPYRQRRQRGAALLIVLLLVATLAFVALSITERTALAAARSVNARARAEVLWLAFGAERLAVAAIEAAYTANDGKMSLDDPWASQPLPAPHDNGKAQLFFADATACLNVNALAADIDEDAAAIASPMQEFAWLARNLGLGEFEGERIAHVIADWVDEDTSRMPQGAEDAYYAVLPSPYRTGNQKLASLSELRAMKGVSRQLYRTLKPHLCAHTNKEPSKINVNMLENRHAPLLAAVLGEDITVLQAEDIIAARPPGGYADPAEFFAQSAVKALDLEDPPAARFTVASNFLQTRAEIVYDSVVFEMTAEIELNTDGKARVLARRFGAEE